MKKERKIHQKFMDVVNSLVNEKIKKEPIQAVILGGSVARGDETKHSDIDIVFYVKKKDLPENKRGFYKFKGKCIEEHYFSIEDLKNSNLLPEEKIIYGKTGKIKIPKFNEKLAKKKFKDSLKQAKKFQKLAESDFKKGDYEKAFYYLYSMESPSFIMMHSLPPRFNLPFPSFRLLNSIKSIDKNKNTKFYGLFEEFYKFNNKKIKEIMGSFSEAYYLRIKKEGKLKVKYNLEYLKKTFKEYPFIFAYRFIVCCLTLWTFDNSIEQEKREFLNRSLMKVLGIKNISKKLVKEKLEISNKLFLECKNNFI
ncbi:MAG: nucleotidyltransferase domain-containing protein [Candidatus Diapherotrites archaeon]